MKGSKHQLSLSNNACFYFLLTLYILFNSTSITAGIYFVAPDGNDSNGGTSEKPFGSLLKGCNVSKAGDTVYIRGGTYEMNKGINISKNGASNEKRIYFLAYQKEHPVFDFSGITSQTNGVTLKNCAWLYFKGLEFCNVPQLNAFTPSCIQVDHSAHITFELCEFHHNGGTGLFISYGTGGHLILNCDSHDNYDPLSGQGDGQNADGFGVHYQTAGTDTTVVSGCRGWWNSDDGIDCIHQNTAVIFENSWFWLNGYKPGLLERPLAGNGQGIKAGGYDLPPNRVPVNVPQNIVRNCVSFLNGDRGLNANYHPVACKWYNNTSFGNKGGNVFMEGIDYKGESDYTRGVNKAILRNNISFNGSIRNCDGAGIDASHNSWDISGFKISEDDFVSIDTTGVFGPRKEDGSLPDIDFMKLAENSALIDAGEDVGLSFSGDAPDLGAFEYQDPLNTNDMINRNKPLKKSALPEIFTGSEYMIYDLSGRKITEKTCRNNCGIFIYNRLTATGSHHTCLMLHTQ